MKNHVQLFNCSTNKKEKSYIFKIGQTVLIFELLTSCIFKQFDLTNLPIELHKI